MTPPTAGEPPDPNPRRLLRRLHSAAGRIGRVRLPAWAARIRWRVPGLGRQRLLFLDDDPSRADRFLRDYPQAVWVTTVPACLARLAERWDEVHLDHDLGGKTYVDSSETDCGMEVIRWLCKEPRRHLKRTRFFVHTHNATAGLLMVLLMRGGGYKAEFRPFGLDLEKLLAHNETGAGTEGEACSGSVAGWFGRWRPFRARAAALAGAIASRTAGPGPSSTPRDRPDADVAPPIDAAEFGGPADVPEPRAATPAQPALPGSAPVIQPPPSTRSS